MSAADHRTLRDDVIARETRAAVADAIACAQRMHGGDDFASGAIAVEHAVATLAGITEDMQSQHRRGVALQAALAELTERGLL